MNPNATRSVMSRRHLHSLLCLLMVCAMVTQARAADPAVDFVLVLHGGAGVWKKELTPEREKESRAAMQAALLAGHSILKTNGTSLEAVEAAIRVLEDSPMFNAGRGSVLTSEGTVEMDASIMEGAMKKAGAVASVKRIKNPITAARLVMEKSPHVMMVSEGAETFAKQQGLELIAPEYFITPFQRPAQPGSRGARCDWNGGRGRPRRPRPSRRRHVDRRDVEQEIRPRGRFADHRRRDLREQCHVCRFRHRPRRILRSLRGRARCLGADGIQGFHAACRG
jgi:hypothetical protein